MCSQQVALWSQRGRAMLCVCSKFQKYNISSAVFYCWWLRLQIYHCEQLTSVLFSFFRRTSSMLAATNKIHWCVAVCAVNELHANCYEVLHGRPSRLLIALYQSSTRKPDIAIRFGMEELEWCGYPMMKKYWRCVYSFRQNTWTRRTYGQTDGRTPRDGIGRAYAKRHAAGKKWRVAS